MVKCEITAELMGMCFKRVVELPFLPVVGMWLDFSPESDLDWPGGMEVAQLYWDHNKSILGVDCRAQATAFSEGELVEGMQLAGFEVNGGIFQSDSRLLKEVGASR